MIRPERMATTMQATITIECPGGWVKLEGSICKDASIEAADCAAAGNLREMRISFVTDVTNVSLLRAVGYDVHYVRWWDKFRGTR